GATASLGEWKVRLAQAIPAKHKFALRPLAVGDVVVMYGIPVARVAQPILEGGLLTVDNVSHATGAIPHWAAPPEWAPPDVSRWSDRTFLGYHRADGQVGTANVWVVVPLVFCENQTVDRLKDALLTTLGYKAAPVEQAAVEGLVKAYKSGMGADGIQDLPLTAPQAAPVSEKVFPNVEGIRFLTHHSGCGGTRQDARSFCRLLAGYLNHPNVAGATVLSLGCQNAQMQMLQDELRTYYPDFDKPLHLLERQQIGDDEAFFTAALKATFSGLIHANSHSRQPAPLSKLSLGLECGGSDGFSGISANPVLGLVSDRLVALGGKAILAEFPELNGVEGALVQRCTSSALAQRFMELMGAYEKRAEKAGAGFADNPSPGNIRDGLLTDAMKSAGAARKGGTSPVVGIWDYAEPARGAGLHLLCTPGNDVESTTALVGSGANVVVFTTGLGTPTGNPVAPLIKVSSNSDLARQMPNIIDFDAGGVVDGDTTLEAAADGLLELLIQVASGQPTKAMQNHQEDFIPWKRDISL
ncbi:MAG: altronate dehydratase, partial [Bacteroidetes bacterium]|nr:altronate dehydratase [Bacteroidota bacterium]